MKVGQLHNKISKEKIKKTQLSNWKTGKNKINSGCFSTEKMKNNKNGFKRGYEPWNKNKTFEQLYGINGAIEKKLMISKKNSGKKQEVEHIRKRLARRTMSSLEKKFMNICIDLNLQYSFVGNGKLFIENKNPDFVKFDGMILVEVFYTRHKCIVSTKDKFCVGFDVQKLEKYKNDRAKTFGKYGWKVIFLDETQVNKDYILKLKNGGFL